MCAFAAQGLAIVMAEDVLGPLNNEEAGRRLKTSREGNSKTVRS